MDRPAIKAGDRVKPLNRTEVWTVAAIQGDRLVPMGWPPGTVYINTVELVYSCSQEQHLAALGLIIRSEPHYRESRAEYVPEWARKNLIDQQSDEFKHDLNVLKADMYALKELANGRQKEYEQKIKKLVDSLPEWGVYDTKEDSAEG